MNLKIFEKKIEKTRKNQIKFGKIKPQNEKLRKKSSINARHFAEKFKISKINENLLEKNRTFSKNTPKMFVDDEKHIKPLYIFTH